MDLPSLSHIPEQFQHAAALLAGLLALSGLILWSAGIKVARALSATFTGIILAIVSGAFLPQPTGLAPVVCVLIGLAAGLIVGVLAFRMLQGVALAACCAVALAGGFYHWQQTRPVAIPAASLNVESVTAPNSVAALEAAKLGIRAAGAWWQAIPIDMRQQMLVIAGGCAIVAFALALAFARQTTWIFTAVAGSAMFLAGSLLLLQHFLPALFIKLPTETPTRLVSIGIFILLGMIIQHSFFWPRKQQQEQRMTGSPLPV